MNKSTRFIVFCFLSLTAVFLAACNAALPAGAEANVSADGKSAQVEFTGAVDSIAADQWVISGQTVLISAQTVIDGVFASGDSVKVHATVTTNGAVTADKIESPSSNDSQGQDEQSTPDASNGDTQELTGKVEAIAADSWTVAGQLFSVNAQTEIKDNILLGDMVKVHFVKNTDGTFSATEIELADKQANDSEQNNQGDNQDDKEITGKVDAFTPDAWTVKGQVFAINAQTEIKDTILLGDVVKVHYVVNPDGTFTATEISLAGDNQAHNSDKKLTGVLEELTPTQATIGGVVVLITADTKLDSGLVIGENVKAEVVTNSDGSVTALEIKSAKESQSGDSQSDDKNHKGGSDNGSGRGGGDDKTPEPGDDNGSDH